MSAVRVKRRRGEKEKSRFRRVFFLSHGWMHQILELEYDLAYCFLLLF